MISDVISVSMGLQANLPKFRDLESQVAVGTGHAIEEPEYLPLKRREDVQCSSTATILGFKTH